MNVTDVSSRDGSALSGIDYGGFTTRLVSFGTHSDTAVVDVAILPDRENEGDETFTVEIQGSDVQIGEGTMTVTIKDNDGTNTKLSSF